MMAALTGALLLLSAVPLICAVLIAIQVAATLFPRKNRRVPDICPALAVVIPAHNESRTIERTIHSLKSHLPAGGRLVVVADNCTDRTVEIALMAGAQVTVRNDTARLGKGYALDHGVRFLERAPPDVVIFVDADCQVGPNTLETLAIMCVSTRRPVQARYCMDSAYPAGVFDRISQFAWRMKTFIRPLGASNLGWPCQLMGTGMAFPWEVIRPADLATAHLAEDQKLGADLALLGWLPIFCHEVHVRSRFPHVPEGKRTQRTRWEHGHLAIIREYLPRLTARALGDRSVTLLAFALDLCVPPMSLLLISLAAIESLNLSWLMVSDAIAPLLTSSLALMLLATSFGLAWWRFGRDTILLGDLFVAPAYCIVRIPSLFRYFVHRQVDWIRTKR